MRMAWGFALKESGDDDAKDPLICPHLLAEGGVEYTMLPMLLCEAHSAPKHAAKADVLPKYKRPTAVEGPQKWSTSFAASAGLESGRKQHSGLTWDSHPWRCAVRR